MGDTPTATGHLTAVIPEGIGETKAAVVVPVSQRRRHVVVLGLAVVVALSGLLGWLGYEYQQQRQKQMLDGEFLEAARQGALNLTTIDWQRADADVQRIIDGAAGPFYDDFASRSQPFIDVVKQAQSVSVGTVTEAGLEDQTGDEAQALVAVSVQTSSSAGAEPVPRLWRMRVGVQKIDDQFKVSRVEFVQ